VDAVHRGRARHGAWWSRTGARDRRSRWEGPGGNRAQPRGDAEHPDEHDSRNRVRGGHRDLLAGRRGHDRLRVLKRESVAPGKVLAGGQAPGRDDPPVEVSAWVPLASTYRV